jgi:hypothetical protein
MGMLPRRNGASWPKLGAFLLLIAGGAASMVHYIHNPARERTRTHARISRTSGYEAVLYMANSPDIYMEDGAWKSGAGHVAHVGSPAIFRGPHSGSGASRARNAELSA